MWSGKMKKLLGTWYHENFSWCEKNAIVLYKHAIVLRDEVEKRCAKSMHKGRINHGKQNIAGGGIGT